MADRRPLVEGLKPTPAPIPPGIEKEFIYGKAPPAAAKPAATPEPPVPAHAPAKQPAGKSPMRVPLSTRMRSDFATALKRASLERQLAGIEPSSLQDLLEEAVEPWLRSNGYIK